MLNQLRPALTLLVIFTALTGIAYPFAMTGVAGAVFPDAAALHAAGITGRIPADAITTSGSGLDPDISPAYAKAQIAAVAAARSMPVETLRGLVAEHITGRTLGLLGEPRVNVLELNLALDQLAPKT